MPRSRPKTPNSEPKPATGGTISGYEAELWAMADALRGTMDAAEYKHVVLGLIFLKYISDAFEETHAAARRRELHSDRRRPPRMGSRQTRCSRH